MPDLATMAILALAGALQGFLGFGFGIVAMTGLTLSHDLLHAAGVVNIVGLTATFGQLLGLHEHVRWKLAARIVPTLLVGVVLGVTALRTFDRQLMVQILGLSTVVLAAWNLWRPRLSSAERPAVDRLVGLVSGLLGGAFNIGGPPMIAHLYRRPDTPDTLRATLQVLFLCIGSSRAVTATAQGLFDRSMVGDALVSIPLMAVGLYAGFLVSRRVAAERFRIISWAMLGLLGSVLFLRA
ncbi:MAG: hypothetical protein CL910_03440 [Deltaproteobacteria bacterium]|jgi:hypothetical protein|nr:hypothetical protein [Deltaproteobacteria bacterium]